MKGSIVTKMLALVILCVLAIGAFVVAKLFMEPMWAILVGIATPLLLIVGLGTLFDDGKTPPKQAK